MEPLPGVPLLISVSQGEQLGLSTFLSGGRARGKSGETPGFSSAGVVECPINAVRFVHSLCIMKEQTLTPSPFHLCVFWEQPSQEREN